MACIDLELAISWLCSHLCTHMDAGLGTAKCWLIMIASLKLQSGVRPKTGPSDFSLAFANCNWLQLQFRSS